MAPAEAFAAAPPNAAACRVCRMTPSRSGRVGGPQNRADVVGVLDPVEHDDERRASSVADQVGRTPVPWLEQLGHDSLVGAAVGGVIEDRPAHLLDLDARRRGQPEDFGDARTVPIADPQPRDTARLEGFEDRIDAKNQHGARVYPI